VAAVAARHAAARSPGTPTALHFFDIGVLRDAAPAECAVKRHPSLLLSAVTWNAWFAQAGLVWVSNDTAAAAAAATPALPESGWCTVTRMRFDSSCYAAAMSARLPRRTFWPHFQLTPCAYAPVEAVRLPRGAVERSVPALAPAAQPQHAASVDGGVYGQAAPSSGGSAAAPPASLRHAALAAASSAALAAWMLLGHKIGTCRDGHIAAGARS
jgi:hypothetical protein